MTMSLRALSVLAALALAACSTNVAIPPAESCSPAFDVPCDGGVECLACDDGRGASWFECSEPGGGDPYVVAADSPDAADVPCFCFPRTCATK